VKSAVSLARSELKKEQPQVFAKLESLTPAQAKPLRAKLSEWVRTHWVTLGGKSSELMAALKNILIDPTGLEVSESDERKAETGNLLKEALKEARKREAVLKGTRALTKLQAVAKGKFVRKTEAATVVQAAVRGKQARKQAQELRGKQAAATVVQAAVRGLQARKLAAGLKVKAQASARIQEPPQVPAASEGLDSLSWTAVHKRWKEVTGKKGKNLSREQMVSEIRGRGGSY
jgi:hypothetical protein